MPNDDRDKDDDSTPIIIGIAIVGIAGILWMKSKGTKTVIQPSNTPIVSAIDASFT